MSEARIGMNLARIEIGCQGDERERNKFLIHSISTTAKWLIAFCFASVSSH